MKVSTVFDGLILLVLISLLIISKDYPFQLKLLPWIFIPLAIILLSIQMVTDLRNKTAGTHLIEWVKAAKDSEGKYLKTVLWILGLFVFLFIAGFMVAAPVFTVLFLRANGESWRYSVCLSAIGWGIFFATFIYALNVRLYEGKIYLYLFS